MSIASDIDSLLRAPDPRRMLWGRLAIVSFLVPLGARAQELSFPPPVTLTFPLAPTAAISDGLELVTEADEQRINLIAEALSRDRGVALRFATVASLAAHGAAHWTVERYAEALFARWKLGRDAVLLLVARDDRKARIQFGPQWGSSKDAGAALVMDEDLVPRFKARRYSEAFVLGAQALDDLVRGKVRGAGSYDLTSAELAGVLAVLGFLGAVLVSLARRGRGGWGWVTLRVFGYVCLGVIMLAAMLALRGSSSSASSSSGGGGGGTGGSGGSGGGATGSW